MRASLQSNDIFDNPLFKNGPVVVFLWKNQDGWPVQNVTDNVVKLLGYEAEEFKNGSVKYANLISKADIQRVGAEVEDANLKKLDSFTHKPYMVTTKNGDAKWLLDNTITIRDEQNNITHYLGYLIDITEQTNFEKQAAELKERYELAIDGSNDGIWDWNVKTDEVYFSPKWKAMLGFAPDEIENSLDEWSKRVHPDDVKHVEEALNRHLQKIEPFYESKHRVMCKNGRYKWILDRGKALFDENGDPVRMAGSRTDIDKEKELEDELNDALSKFMDIFNISQVGLALLDPNGKILEANDKSLEIFHLNRDGTLKQDYATKLVKAIKPDGTLMKPEEYAGMGALKEKKPIYNVELCIDDGKGGTAWVVANAVPLDGGNKGVIVSYTDITYRKELEDSLKKINENLNAMVENELQKRLSSEMKLERIFESISVGVTVVDEDGNYVDFNNAYAHIYGYEKSELVGKSFFITTKESDTEQIKKHHYDFMHGDKSEEKFYFQARTKNGDIIDILGTSSKTTMDGKPYKITTIMDITEQKRQEKLLIEQSRMAEMGEMIGVIAHQWRQPLNAVALIVQDIKSAYKYGEADEEYINKSVKDSMEILNFMSKTIDDFRGFFRKDKEKSVFEVCNTALGVAELIKPQLTSNNIDISIDINCKLYKNGVCNWDKEGILGYPNEFKQAMLNLITNAKDAILEKREKDKNSEKGKILITVNRGDQYVTISVQDNGTGIKHENMGKIFEPYFSTKSISGTGIGLYMAKTIIEKNMNGTIKAFNTDNGAIFEATFPIQRQD